MQLGYNVVHCTAQDPSQPSSNLVYNTGTWSTGVQAEYPVEIGFQFVEPVHIRSLDILTHTYQVPSCIEVATDDQSSWAHVYEYSQFCVHGSITFDAPSIAFGTVDVVNRKQMRHVKLNCKCSKLRLRVYKPHSHPKNPNDTVTIARVSVEGSMVEPMSASRDALSQLTTRPLVNPNRLKSVCEGPCTTDGNNNRSRSRSSSSSANMYRNHDGRGNNDDDDGEDDDDRTWVTTNVDSILRHIGLANQHPTPSSAQNVSPQSSPHDDGWKHVLEDFQRQLRERKEYCTVHELYDEAQTLKMALIQMAKTCRAVEKMDKKKQYAIMTEDFGRASELKTQIIECVDGARHVFHSMMASDPRLFVLAAEQDTRISGSNCDDNDNNNNDDIDDGDHDNGGGENNGNDHNDLFTLLPLCESDARIASMTDACTLTALGVNVKELRSKKPQFASFLDKGGPPAPPPDLEPEALSAQMYAKAEPLFEMFGQRVMMCFHSKHWALREYAVRHICSRVKSMANDSSHRRVHFKASAYIVRAVCDDSNAQVFMAGLMLLQHTLESFDGDEPGKDIALHWDCVVRACVSKLGNNQQRIRVACSQALIQLGAHSTYSRQHIIKYMMKTQPAKRKWKLLLGYLQVLHELIADDHRNAHFPTDSVMKFICECMQNPHSYVRSASISVYTSVAERAPQEAEAYVKSLRPTILQMLREQTEPAPTKTNSECPSQPKLDDTDEKPSSSPSTTMQMTIATAAATTSVDQSENTNKSNNPFLRLSHNSTTSTTHSYDKDTANLLWSM